MDNEKSLSLFERLRRLRQQIAFEKRLPPYVIFSNKTLEEMATSMPTSMDELTLIYGVGNTKLQRYGEQFLDEILKYRTENNISTGFSAPQRLKDTPRQTIDSYLPMDIEIAFPDRKTEDIKIENFEQVKMSLQKVLSDYDNILYTPDQLKKAKNDRATLNKIKRAISARSKEIKDICLEPFYYADAQLKELQQLIDIPLARITEFTSAMEQMLRDTKSETIKIYYDQLAGKLGSLADAVFFSSWFYNKKWENKTTPDWLWRKEIADRIGEISQTVEELTFLAGNNASSVIAKFIETGDKDQALRFLESIQSIQAEKGTLCSAQSDSAQEANTAELKEDNFAQKTELLIKITGTDAQQQALLRFLKEAGIAYEVFVVK